MPKPLKKRAISRPKADPNEAAFDLVRRSTEEGDEGPTVNLSTYMAEIGRRGGMGLHPITTDELEAKCVAGFPLSVGRRVLMDGF